MNNNEVLKSIAMKAKRRLVGKETVSKAKIRVISNDDDDFRNRVEFLMSQEGVISNPVTYLIDDKMLRRLNETDRERYILSTLDRYNILRNKLEKSSGYSSFCM